MSALYSIQDVLNPVFLSEQYTSIASVSIQNPFFDFYHNGRSPQNVNGDVIEIVKFDDDREPAPLNVKGAPAKTLDARGAGKKYFSPIHVFNEVTIPLASVEYLRQADNPQMQQKGIDEIRRQMELFGRRHRLTRAVALAKALADGVIYANADGVILESSSGAALTIDLGVDATHKSQLNHAAFGADIIGTAWDAAGAKILTDLDQIAEAAEYDMVAQPRHVWLHTTAKAWIRENTEIKAFLVLNSPRAEEVLSGIGDTLVIGNYTFHFYNGTYKAADGTVKPLIPKAKAIITPEPNDGTWLRNLNASEIVPTGEGIKGSLEEAMADTTVVYGDFAYLRMDDNPVKLTMRMGSNFLYAFADANAVWMPTVDF